MLLKCTIYTDFAICYGTQCRWLVLSISVCQSIHYNFTQHNTRYNVCVVQSYQTMRPGITQHHNGLGNSPSAHTASASDSLPMLHLITFLHLFWPQASWSWSLQSVLLSALPCALTSCEATMLPALPPPTCWSSFFYILLPNWGRIPRIKNGWAHQKPELLGKNPVQHTRPSTDSATVPMIKVFNAKLNQNT